MDLIVVFCIVSCLYLCLPCCVSVSLPNFRWIKIYIPLSWEHWKTRWPDNTHLLLTDYFLFIYWYPRDAMLARVLAIMALYLSVCLSVCLCLFLSVTSRCSIETDERIELMFGMRTSFHLSCTVFEGNSVFSENKTTYLWNFVPNSERRPVGYALLLFLIYLFLTIYARPIISKSSGPIFAKFSELVELWL